jgi:acyl-CoA synthetase (NDP forming)
VQEELPSAEGVNDKAANLRVVNDMAAAPGAKPVAVVSMASYMYSDYTRTFREGFMRLPVLHEVDKALKALRRVGDWNEATLRAHAAPPFDAISAPAQARAILARATPAGDGLRVLGEADSKALLDAYGVKAPREAFAADVESAAAAARSIGFPVVLKLVSPDVQHKTEVGGVLVGVSDEAGVREGFAKIRTSLAHKAPNAAFEGVLVAQQAGRGVELVIGVQRDPEVGPVLMFGSGGILLEVAKDVAFGAVPMTPDDARRLMARTGASHLLAGFRGAPPCDVEAVAAAICAISRLAADFAEEIESVDINPLIAIPGERGALALDALVILRDKHKTT